MESAKNTFKFTTLALLKALGDRNHNILVYKYHPIQNGSHASVPFELIKVIKAAHEGHITLLKPFLETESQKQYLISASFDKQLKLWDLNTEPPTVLDSFKHPKKIDFGFLDIEKGSLIFSDKTGDIFETNFSDLKLSKPQMPQANMDTLTFFNREKISDGRDLLFMADQAQKLKICKYPEIYHILNIFSPHKDTNFVRIIDLTPNALVLLLSNGEIELLNLKSIDENEYLSKRLDIKAKIEGKQVYDIVKVDSEHFIAVDHYFTVLVVVKINGLEVLEEKVLDISQLKILSNEEDHNTERFIEVDRDGDNLVLFIKYERSTKTTDEQEESNKEEVPALSEIRLSERVYFRKFALKL